MNPLQTSGTQTSVNLHDYRRAFLYKDTRTLRFTYYVFALLRRPWAVRLLTALASWAMRTNMPVTGLIRNTVFRVFCAGETLDEAIATIKKLEWYKVSAVLDYVSEGECIEAAFERNTRIITANITVMSEEAPGNAVSVKLTGLEDPHFLERINLADPGMLSPSDRKRYDGFVDRVDRICSAAAKKKVTVYIDAEDRCIQDVFDHVVELMMARYNRTEAVIYNTVQMYLKDRVAYLRRVITESEGTGYYPGLKLVRGAYVEKERQYARSKGQPSPVHDTKEATDDSFDIGLNLCLSHSHRVYTCIASHNERSTLLAIHQIGVHGVGDHFKKVKFSQLYGMSDNLTFNLAARGYNASKYLPYGEVKKAVPYLIRRAEENSSISGQMPKELSYLKKEIGRRKHQVNAIFA